MKIFQQMEKMFLFLSLLIVLFLSLHSTTLAFYGVPSTTEQCTTLFPLPGKCETTTFLGCGNLGTITRYANGTCDNGTKTCCVPYQTDASICGYKEEEKGICRRESTTSTDPCNSNEKKLTTCTQEQPFVNKLICCVPKDSATVPAESDTQCANSCGGKYQCVPTGSCPSEFPKQNGTCQAGWGGYDESKCCIPESCTPAAVATPSTPPSHNASLNYTTLEDIPGFKNTSADFPTYLKNLYLFAIWVIALSALFMLIVGGFLYLSSAGNNSLISTAKKTISYALMGLIIGLTSWLILNTINPDLTNISLTGFSSSGGNSSAGPSTPITGTPAAGADAAGCNALKYVSVKNQCSLASSAIVSALKCIESAGITNKVYSLTSNGVGGDLAKSKACCGNGGGGDCPHSDVSCHHGCTMGNANKGLSFGADMEIPSGASDTTLCDIANKAKTCGIGNIWGPRTISSCGITYQSGHSTHLHLSAAGCAH